MYLPQLPIGNEWIGDVGSLSEEEFVGCPSVAAEIHAVSSLVLWFREHHGDDPGDCLISIDGL